MTRCRLGVGLLLLFLVLGLASAFCLGRFGEELGREAERAAALAAGDRAEAEKILKQVRDRWEAKRLLLTVLTDHGPIREADTLFALLESPLEADSFREKALELSQNLRQLGRSQLPKLENIL